MSARLYRVILPVNDIDQAEKFYSEILDQEGIRVSPGRHYFNIGGTILACYDPKSDGDDVGAWKFHENQYIYICVSDLKSVRDKMKTLDCRSIGSIEDMPWGETLFYASDPFGNPICFVDEKTIFTGD
ncbi:VOC family protein [Marinoscillum sp. MHG1-6]|uniref:VOC family protein n=1 Tax=Marinoscillum sp. MHG1-6 TaxID=2959627 RepID=UPI0021582612|nr:VOC family protein [Marinoscillum sp. MHG1-6]